MKISHFFVELWQKMLIKESLYITGPPILGTPEAAWDVWMLFDRDVRWEGDLPPRPAWWEHQLNGMPPELLLDSERFAKKAREILSRKAAPAHALPQGTPLGGL